MAYSVLEEVDLEPLPSEEVPLATKHSVGEPSAGTLVVAVQLAGTQPPEAEHLRAMSRENGSS